MAQDGEINLKEVKAKYSVKDIVFIDSRELDFTNEFRLTYEISFGIGIALFGSVFTQFNWYLLIVSSVFILFGTFNLIRYLRKRSEINKTKDNDSKKEKSVDLNKLKFYKYYDKDDIRKHF